MRETSGEEMMAQDPATDLPNCDALREPNIYAGFFLIGDEQIDTAQSTVHVLHAFLVACAATLAPVLNGRQRPVAIEPL